MGEYVINTSAKHSIRYKGQMYLAYIRYYNTGQVDVEVYPMDDETADVDGDVHEFAWNFFEECGMISFQTNKVLKETT